MCRGHRHLETHGLCDLAILRYGKLVLRYQTRLRAGAVAEERQFKFAPLTLFVVGVKQVGTLLVLAGSQRLNSLSARRVLDLLSCLRTVRRHHITAL